MFIDFMTPFTDAAICQTVLQLQQSPLFFQKPAYIAEMQKAVVPTPAVCEGTQCICCRKPVLRLETPMDFYEDACDKSVCSEDCAETYAAYAEDDTDVDEDAMDAYIDAVLDNDYDW